MRKVRSSALLPPPMFFVFLVVGDKKCEALR